MKSRFGVVTACVVLLTSVAFPVDRSGLIIEKAKRAFGDPLNAEHHVFPLNDTYVVWLILDNEGNLFEVVVGPKSYYKTEFPGAKTPSRPEFLSEAEYEDTLRRISGLKHIGALKKRHGTAIWSALGAFSTDCFEEAFVDRIVGDAPADLQDGVQSVRRFDLYFFEDIAGSPKQVRTEPNSMVCLGNAWYYLPPEDVKRIHLGKWQTLHVAGPNLYVNGCTRTTTLYDADGFTIEEPANEMIVVDEPYTVQELVGQVHLGESPLEGVNVEVRRQGSKKVLRTKTTGAGAFRFPGVPEGRYKFKVTKDGFKSLSGTILVNRHAGKGSLSFELPVGT